MHFFFLQTLYSYNLCGQIFLNLFTYYFNGPKQDPSVEFQKSKIKNNFMQFALEGLVLECSFLKHSQRILGVK
jgi:hypothetical protein